MRPGVPWSIRRLARMRDQMTQPRIGLLIVISGPSGVGKDTVLRRLFELAPHLNYSVSYTTRPPRPGEVDGHSYTFVSEPEFLRLIEQKEFLERAKDYDHVVCNRDVDETAREILAMIAAEHERRRGRYDAGSATGTPGRDRRLRRDRGLQGDRVHPAAHRGRGRGPRHDDPGG